uniref:Uncharacterized protein n=1 Tax=Setaria viridis TaxID=4556 RepID=A0A4U6TYS5_SETVI|nr:hypothetical protein SEVIR_6G019750v2 [Setaria viridis]
MQNSSPPVPLVLLLGFSACICVGCHHTREQHVSASCANATMMHQ